MKDTQWQRYQVFVQEKPGDPYLDFGSVHAPDGEMALQNARDVFARRPGVYSMWVVPAEAIFSQTRQELEQAKGDDQEWTTEIPAEAKAETYRVSCKPKAAGTQTSVGSVEARSPQEAMRKALNTYLKGYPAGKEPFAWWVFPDWLVLQSDPKEAGSLFAPALDKPFRLSTDFHVVTAMRTLKSKQ